LLFIEAGARSRTTGRMGPRLRGDDKKDKPKYRGYSSISTAGSASAASTMAVARLKS
jgi:hypothetical protein